MKHSYGPVKSKLFLKKKKPFGVLSSAQQAAVRKIINKQRELKYIAVSGTGGVNTTPSLTGTPFDVAEGTTDSERVGDALTWCGHIDLRLQVVNSTLDVFNITRVVIFQWFPNSTPTAASVFLAGPSGNPDIFSQYNHDRRQEYMILFDRTYRTVGPASSATNPAQSNRTTGVKNYKISLAKAHKNVQYSSGGITGTNLLYFYVVSNSSSGTSPTLSYSSKTVFRDS